jgi:integral membrane protein
MMGAPAIVPAGEGKVAVLSTPIGRLRVFSLLEAISFIALLSIAVPMQIAGNDSLVGPAGATHGVLFIMYVLSTWQVRQALSWPNGLTAKVLLAAVIPFAPFWVERWLRTLHAPVMSPSGS